MPGGDPTQAASSCAQEHTPFIRHGLRTQTQGFSLPSLRLCPHTGWCPHPSHVPSSPQLALLTELSQNRGGDSCRPFAGPQSGPAFNSVFQKENFQLQLAPPPVAED